MWSTSGYVEAAQFVVQKVVAAARRDHAGQFGEPIYDPAIRPCVNAFGFLIVRIRREFLWPAP
jgi:hypothetical protein